MRLSSVIKLGSGVLLVAGTAVGAGMLALPVATSVGGFWPALAMYLVCWTFMAATGLLFLEVCIWMPHKANMVTMSRQLFGKFGAACCWAIYIFFFYSLTIAYVAGGGEFFYVLGNGLLKNWQSTVLFVLIFGSIVFIGAKAIHGLNYVLMTGLAIAYLLFVFIGWKHVDLQLLFSRLNWWEGALALPIIFASFGYQGVIPSLKDFLNRNVKMVRLSILIGTSIPLVCYVIWEYLILGIVPLEGANGLLEAKALGQTAVYPLRNFVPSAIIYPLGQFFAFFALTTSFLGVTLGLVDFLADSLKVSHRGVSRLALCFMVFLPPMAIAIYNPNIFLIALTYAGGIGSALLLGLFPVIMVWVGRYKKNYPKETHQLPGGKLVLILLGAFVLFELCIEVVQEYARIFQ